MLDRRNESRIATDLPVQIWGLDVKESAFIQWARARNVSRCGALLTGIEKEVRRGDVLWVQHGVTMTKFRVVWVKDSRGFEKFQVAVQKEGESQCPWSEMVCLEGVLADTTV
jgi:hypothetical protein